MFVEHYNDPIPVDQTKTIVNVQLHAKLKQLFFRYRFKILYGGRGSGKSWSVAIYILIKCLQSKQRVLCLREFQASIEQSVYNLFTSLIELFHLEPYFNITNNKIQCFNGSLIFFKGAARNPSSLKSLEGISICWFEEAQVASTNTLELLLPTIRKSQSEVIFTLNPENEDDPIMRAFFKKSRNNTLYVELNFSDNPFFTEEMEELRLHCLENDPELYEHIWAGKTRKYSQEQIFGGKWVIAKLDPPKQSIMYQGLDWGYSSDPFAFIQIYIDHNTNELFIYREAGGYHVEIDDYPAHLKPIPGSNRFATYCDSANPGNMNLLKRMGYNALPCKKYAGSIEDGITYIRSFKRIYVDESCSNVIEELKNYKWKRDPKTQQLTPVPIDKHNHWLDSLRYALTPFITDTNISALQWQTFTGRNQPKETNHAKSIGLKALGR